LIFKLIFLKVLLLHKNYAQMMLQDCIDFSSEASKNQGQD